jgi:hypothetical protein
VTLIVANITPRGIWLTSDMRITDRSAANARGFFGAALKLVLVSPTLCIGYAGTLRAALAGIRAVAYDAMTPAAATEHLLGIHLADSAVDFLVASLQPPTLLEIKNGRALQRQSAWLGDQNAFSRYQEFYHGEHFLPPAVGLDPDYTADLDVAVMMNDAMQDLVLADGELDGPGASDALVGEASVTVGPRGEDGLFNYHLYVSNRGPFAASRPAGESLMSTELGSFTISMLAPAEPGVGAVGIYFAEGRLGILYAPLLTLAPDQPDRFQDCTVHEFVDKVMARYGIALRGVGGLGPSLNSE